MFLLSFLTESVGPIRTTTRVADRRLRVRDERINLPTVPELCHHVYEFARTLVTVGVGGISVKAEIQRRDPDHWPDTLSLAAIGAGCAWCVKPGRADRPDCLPAQAGNRLLHLAASINTRAVVPSTILKKLSASPRESQLAKALRELGPIERSLSIDRMVFESGIAPAMSGRSSLMALRAMVMCNAVANPAGRPGYIGLSKRPH